MFRVRQHAIIDLNEEVEPAGAFAEISRVLAANQATVQDDIHPDRHDHRDRNADCLIREPRR